MEDSQQKIATILYRAETEDGPSFDSDETINEGNFYLSIHSMELHYAVTFYVSKINNNKDW